VSQASLPAPASHEDAEICRLGNLRYSRQGSLRYVIAAVPERCSVSTMPPENENPQLDRVRFQLRASGLKDLTHDVLYSGIHTRGYLPHVKHEGSEYFVTFRLNDSLPKEVLLRYERERSEKIRSIRKARQEGRNDAENERLVNRDFRRKIEQFLDQGAGACHLRRPEIAILVVNALRFFHEQRYLLNEWVVMPNHVHAMFWPMPNHVVSRIVKSWKQFTSSNAKRILGLQSERFWQPESYDHWIRNDDERARIAQYIRNNPVAAGLCARPEDWRWSSAWRVPE
jgi:REP element-mobilizing transposase RayT